MPLSVPAGLTLINDQVLSGTSSDIQFLSIPQSYRHLLLVGMGRGDTAAATVGVNLKLNNDGTGTNYNIEILQGSNASVTSAVTTTGNSACATLTAASGTAGRAGGFHMMIPSYAGTTFNKVAFANSYEHSGAAALYQLVGVTWANTAAITQIDLTFSAGNVIAGSQFTLYGF